MGQETKDQARNRMRGLGINGSMSRSESGSETARNRRGPQREADFGARYDQDKFGLNGEGQVALKLTNVLGVAVRAMDPITWRPGETSPSDDFDLGYVVGPKMDAANDEVFAHWMIPPDCDRTKPVTLHGRIAQDSTDAGAFENDVEVYAHEATSNVVTGDGSPVLTLEWNGTATSTTGDAHAFDSEMAAATIFPNANVEALVFKAINVSLPHTAQDLVWHMGAISYTRTLTPATHKHE